jgi:hypothetical protein
MILNIAGTKALIIELEHNDSNRQDGDRPEWHMHGSTTKEPKERLFSPRVGTWAWSEQASPILHCSQSLSPNKVVLPNVVEKDWSIDEYSHYKDRNVVEEKIAHMSIHYTSNKIINPLSHRTIIVKKIYNKFINLVMLGQAKDTQLYSLHSKMSAHFIFQNN